MSELSATYFEEGQVVLIDKPLEWTSFDVVNKLRYAIRKTFGLRKIKVGHAGTLDPLATGLLIICTGKATKRIEEYMGGEKEYTGTIALGATTPSYDRETDIDKYYPIDHIDNFMIENLCEKFTGEIEQIPPAFSAIKKGGVKAYEKARKGEDIKLESRKIYIRELELTRTAEAELKFRVVCSKGTYIRSLAYDLGQALGSGAYLSSLRRTRIGDFSVEEACGPLEFTESLSE